MTIVAGIFNLLEENATPWAWFPAEQAITPDIGCGEFECKWAIILYAPLNLNEKNW